METRLVYSKATGDIIGSGLFDATAETETQGIADIPPGYKGHEYPIWRYDPGTEKMKRKTGQDLADAMVTLKARTRSSLVKKHVGKLIDPAIQGGMEAAMDLVVQMVHRWVNGEVPTQAEKDTWNAFITTCSLHYKITLGDATQKDFDDMAVKKQTVRQAEADMYNDPDWPG